MCSSTTATTADRIVSALQYLCCTTIVFEKVFRRIVFFAIMCYTDFLPKICKICPQILLAIDDSESMADCGAGALALAAMTTVASGLTQLEAGQFAVAR